VTYRGFKSRANLTWRITPDTMVYALFSQGFRPGAFNRSNSKTVFPDASGKNQFLEPNGYAPDNLNNYEVGLKSQLFDHRLLLNVSAYYMQWQHVQFYLFDPVFGVNTTFGINGPSYDVKGVEIQAVARPTDNLTLQGSLSYNDSTESVAPCLKDNRAATAEFGQCITQAISKATGALAPFPNPFGVTGAVTAFSPQWQGTALARYDWEMGDYKPYVQADVTYVGQMFNQPASYISGAGILVPSTTFLRYSQPAYATLDAAIGVAWGGHWRAELYGSNLTDSHASTFTSSAQFIKSEVPLRPLVVEAKIFADF
jgi:outer membrane receptor protein involved in Fe transport